MSRVDRRGGRGMLTLGRCILDDEDARFIAAHDQQRQTGVTVPEIRPGAR